MQEIALDQRNRLPEMIENTGFIFGKHGIIVGAR